MLMFLGFIPINLLEKQTHKKIQKIQLKNKIINLKALIFNPSKNRAIPTMADSHSLSFYNSFSSFFPNPLLALFVFVSLFFFFLFRSMTLSFSLSVLVSFQILNLSSCVYVQILAIDGCGHRSQPWGWCDCRSSFGAA